MDNTLTDDEIKKRIAEIFAVYDENMPTWVREHLGEVYQKAIADTAIFVKSVQILVNPIPEEPKPQKVKRKNESDT